MSDSKSLWVVPSVPVWQSQGKLCFDLKFYEGMLAYARLWPGPVHCLMRQASSPPPQFGLVLKTAQEMPFGCSLLGEDELIRPDHLHGAGIVLLGGDCARQHHVSQFCREMGIPGVYVIENTLETRCRIIQLEVRNWLRRLVRTGRAWKDERRRVAAFKEAAGLQANGVPAAKQYGWAKNVHLYFDTRATEEDLVTEPVLESRLAQLMAPAHRLQLAFSGRLIRIKGADYLVAVAQQLKKMGVVFDLHVFGAGDLESWVAREVQNQGLQDCVHLHGAVDFTQVLMPRLKTAIDLFLVPHPQGDPSCTYLETLSCGVPLVGFANAAMTGLLEHAPIGWAVPLGDAGAMARQVAQLNRDRAAICEQSRHALAFARQHTFGREFAGRIEHLKQVLAQSHATAQAARVSTQAVTQTAQAAEA